MPTATLFAVMFVLNQSSRDSLVALSLGDPFDASSLQVLERKAPSLYIGKQVRDPGGVLFRHCQ